MPDREEFKLGDNIQITIKRSKRKAPVVRKRPEKRFGPERHIEDPRTPDQRPEIVFLDCGMQFRQDSLYVANEANPTDFASGVMFYIPRVAGHGALNPNQVELGQQLPALGTTDLWESGYRELHASTYRSRIFNDIDVKIPPFSGTTYRTINQLGPLPHRGIDQLGLKVRLAGRLFSVRENSENWRTRSSAERRLAAAEASGAAPDIIAALTKEVAESNVATGSHICTVVPQEWFCHDVVDQRDLWRDYGIFRPPMANTAQMAIESTGGPYFEPFDTSDTDNYKVVKRLNADNNVSTFLDSAEIPFPGISPRAKARIWLMPQLWHFVISLTTHYTDVWTDFNHVSPDAEQPFTIATTFEGYAPAFSSATVLNGPVTIILDSGPAYVDHPLQLLSYSESAFDPTDTSAAGYLRLMTYVGSWFNVANWYFPQPLVPPGAHTLSPANPPGTLYVFANLVHLKSRSSASVVITQDGAPVGMLVGAIELRGPDATDDTRYYIYRKTARAAAVPVYTGPMDDPRYVNLPTQGPITFSNFLLRPTSAAFTPPSGYPAMHWSWSVPAGLCLGRWPYLAF